MARLKKGEKKKVQMTIRIAPEIAEKLKSIDKYSAKMTAIISSGINDYEKWLNDNIKEEEDLDKIKYDKNNKKINKYFYEYFDDKNIREESLKDCEKDLIKLDKENSLFGQFHPEIMEKKYYNLRQYIDLLKNWDKNKYLFSKNINIDNKKDNI